MEGELRIVTNVGATVIDLIVYLLSNNAPNIQAMPKTTDKLGQMEASVAEELVAKAFKLANFHKTFRDSAWLFSIAGFCWWFPFWNRDKEFGKSKNMFDFSLLNPLSTRIFFRDTDHEKVDAFITTKRMTPSAVYENYDGFEARPDRENPFLQTEIQGADDDMVTVFRQYDAKYCVTVIDNRVADRYEHGLDFAPLIKVNNKYVVNEAYGMDDIFRMLPVSQELNMLISAASEIARDLAWPPIIEYNTALGGRRLPKMRGNKIQVRRTDKGEALEYMVNPAQMEPLLKQIQLLLDLFHFVALMPKAAAGVFDSTVTSGFQAQVAMQPVTLATGNKKIDFDAAIERLAKTALYMIEKNDPKALQVDENTKFSELYDLDFKVVWPVNLPIDIAREIQNLVVGIQNSVTSVTQAIDKYNVLMGMGSSEETLEYLKQESTDVNLAPDRVLKVTQVQQALSQIQQATQQMGGMLNMGTNPDGVLPNGNTDNANNAQAAMGQPESQPGTQNPESVPPTSTGGQVMPPQGPQPQQGGNQ
jgi:hypothetical protein